MSTNLSDIVDIQIRIAAPATGIAGFGSILIVGPEPASKKLDDYKAIGVYTSLEGVKTAGWVEGEAVYDAAAVAFSQQPHPSKIFVAANVKNLETRGTERYIGASIGKHRVVCNLPGRD